MKFTDGFWQLREGVKAHYAAEAYDIIQGPEELEIIAPTKQVRHRGDTINHPMLTVRAWSPAKDIIAVRTTHFAGVQDNGPKFDIRPDGSKAVTSNTGDEYRLTAGDLTLIVERKAPFGLRFEGAGVPIANVDAKGSALFRVDGVNYMSAQLRLGVGELVYGLGERFTQVVKNGQTVDIWNEDGGTSSEQAYKNLPFYLTNRGYGVLVNHSGRVSYEVGSEAVEQVQFSVPGEELEYLVIYGPTPKEILDKYTALTGRPALPPSWSFGLWLSTSFTTSYDEGTVNEFLSGMKQRNIPVSVFHFDCFWMREFNWCDFQWDPRTFPDPEGMLGRMHENGQRVCVWINPYIAQRSPLFREGMENGYLLRRPNGDVWQWDLWQPGMALVDFTNPAARTWFASKLERLMDMGVDAFKTDFGERVPTDVVYYDGSDPVRMHNYYTMLYNETVFAAMERKGRDPILFARSATVGGQQYPVHWGGDCTSTFESMAETLRAGLSLSMSGFGFWSHDIGGFEGTPDPAVFKRWLAFGLLSSHSRLHSSESYRVPWLFGDESVEVAAKFTALKLSLMPYLMEQARQAHTVGTPVMRHMMLEFPEDPTCAHLELQYMLGDSLLVAPVFNASGEVDVYLPEGRWTHLLSGEVVQGPGWRRERHGFDSLPLYVKEGAVIARSTAEGRTDYTDTDVRLDAYTAEGVATEVIVPSHDGGTLRRFTVRKLADGRVEAELH